MVITLKMSHIKVTKSGLFINTTKNVQKTKNIGMSHLNRMPRNRVVVWNFWTFFVAYSRCTVTVNRKANAYLEHRTAVRGALFDFGIVFGAFSEHRLVVVDVGYEHHHDRGTRVYGGRAVRAARAVVHRGDVQLVLVPLQWYRFRVQTDHAGDFFDHELAGRGAAPDESESENALAG